MEFEFKSILRETQSSLLWNFYLEVPEDIVKKLITKNDKRVRCNLNNQLTSQQALSPIKGQGYCLYINKSTRTKLKLKPGDVVNVLLSKDTSEYGIATPDFFKTFCEQDPEGSGYFHQLTPGKQRTLLHLISKIKSEQKQLEKTWIIFDYLKNSKGELDFKELNLAFKESRFKV
jgi:hypothetical protein